MAYSFHLVFFIKLMFVTSVSMAQTATDSKNEKTVLAKELMIVLEADKVLQQRIAGLDQFLNVLLRDNREDPELQKEAVTAVRTQLPAKKAKLQLEAQERFIKEVSNSFSAIELKYLIQAYKHPLNKRFKTFLNSEGYNRALDLPYFETKKAVKETIISIKSNKNKVIKKGP